MKIKEEIIMKDKINNCTTLEELFELWKTEYEGKVFVTDGIVNPQKWNSQKVRPMFLLKDAYGGDANWNLINDHILRHLDSNVDNTWKKVTQWSYGLMNTDENKIQPFDENLIPKKYGNEYLQSMAVVNIKKESGKSKSVWEELEVAVEKDKDFIKREIELIDPTVIVCGYTISQLEKILGVEIKKERNRNLYYYTEINGKTIIVLDYYHPASRYPDIMNYYALVNIYQLALKEKAKGE